MGDKGVGKTKLFYALTNQVNVDTLPSLQSTKFNYILPVTGRLGIVHDFHYSYSLWPKQSDSILYNSIMNILIIRDDMSYMEALFKKNISIRKGLTYFLVGKITQQQVEDKYRDIFQQLRAKQSQINHELQHIACVKGQINYDVEIQDLVKLIQSTM
eukprot:EST43883.1 Hypothetical protein SS50377_16183 [Spironucleus salmonicida]